MLLKAAVKRPAGAGGSSVSRQQPPSARLVRPYNCSVVSSSWHLTSLRFVGRIIVTIYV